MIRFPNPGSDIDQMIKIFKILYANLSNAKYFTLDNMAQVMTLENVASSSGYIGSQAVLKYYERTDKSRFIIRQKCMLKFIEPLDGLFLLEKH